MLNKLIQKLFGTEMIEVTYRVTDVFPRLNYLKMTEIYLSKTVYLDTDIGLMLKL
ncbi:hypothetical protein [Escherichia phage vB_EcoP_EP32B]|nr:hypothetical protein [Escherichia phage vB_EcoP_EP32B]